MKKSLWLSLMFSFIIIYNTLAQIVNIEDKRATINDSIGWFERLDIGYNLINNGQKISTFSGALQIEFSYLKRTYLSISKYNFLKAGEEKFVNEGFQHLRYNYKINKRWFFEAFGQAQYNEQTKIKLRALLGTGFKVELLEHKKIHLNYGFSYMYEYEENKDMAMAERAHRLNNYMSLKWTINPSSKFLNTTYFQPVADALYDFRLSSESTLVFKLSKHFSFKSSFFITHDSRPVVEVVGTVYKFTNGLRWQF